MGGRREREKGFNRRTLPLRSDPIASGEEPEFQLKILGGKATTDVIDVKWEPHFMGEKFFRSDRGKRHPFTKH